MTPNYQGYCIQEDSIQEDHTFAQDFCPTKALIILALYPTVIKEKILQIDLHFQVTAIKKIQKQTKASTLKYMHSMQIQYI